MENTTNNFTNTNNTSMDDVVFEDRNKFYGAYQLRKSYVRNFLLAMITAAAALTLFLLLYSFILKQKDDIVEEELMTDVIVEDVALDEEQPEPPAIEPPPPAVEQIQFLPPEIKETVIEEVIPPSQDELEDVKNIGSENVKGDTIEMIVEAVKENKVIDDSGDDVAYAAVEEPAEFPGGRAAMMKFISKNLTYPKSAERRDIQGRVFVYFEIDKNGKVVNSRNLKGIDKECDDEALRVVRMFPDWKPAKMNGRAVRQQIKLPINFVIPE